MTCLVYSAFFVFRYGGLWIENDTGVFSRAAALFIHHGSLAYGATYNHGFAYTAWLGSLSLLTGLNPATFNTIIMPFLGLMLLVIPGYLAYSILLDSSKLAALGAVILVTIPDITFSAVRGTHEKLSMAFVTLGIFCLFKAFEAIISDGGHRRYRLIQWLLLYLLTVFLNVSTNDYFASTFAFATTLTLAFGFIGLKLRAVPNHESLSSVLKVLSFTVLASWIIVYWVMFIVYPPEARDFLLLKGAINQLSHLFATFQPSTNPYAVASSQWASQAAFDLMNVFRWFIVIVSATMWGIDVFRIAFRKQPLDPRRLFLLALYAAFALLVAISIPLDFSALAVGSNLEVRNFTYVILLGTPFVAKAIYRAANTPWIVKQFAVRKVARPLIIAIMFGMLGLGFLKVTLDPLVSNNWLYYTPNEAEALRFFWTHNHNQILWTGPDDRLAFYAHARLIWGGHGNQIVGYTPLPFTKDFLASPIVISSDRVLNQPMYDYPQNDRIYDNGGAQIYRTRPVSSFMQ